MHRAAVVLPQRRMPDRQARRGKGHTGIGHRSAVLGGRIARQALRPPGIAHQHLGGQ